MIVRQTRAEERSDVRNVLDGANLQIDDGVLKRELGTDNVLVAESSEDSEGRVLGALVLDGNEILAIAVRRRRRDQGIGTALVDAAGERNNQLVAEFDEAVLAFWQSLGFEITRCEESGRYRGRST